MLKKINIFNKKVDEVQLEKEKKSTYLKTLIIIITIVICSSFYILRINNDFTNNNIEIPTKGFVWTGDDIIADYSFPIKRSQEDYEEDLNNISLNNYSIFDFDERISSLEVKKLNELKNSYVKKFSIQNQQELSKINNVTSILNEFLLDIYSKAYINIDIDDVNNILIYSRSKNKRNVIPLENIYDLNRIKLAFNSLNIKNINEEFSNYLESELINNLKPNHTFNQVLTENEYDILKKSIPKTIGFVSIGDVIIRKGDKINDEHLLKLQSYKVSLFERDTHDSKIFIYIGSIGHFILVFSFLLIYIFKLKQEEFYDNVKLTILCTILIIVGFLAYLSISLSYNYPTEYIILIPAFSMLAVIVFDFRTSFYLTVTMSLMSAGIRGNDYSVGISMMFAGILSIYSIRNIKERSQLYKSILFIFIGYFLSILFLGLERNFTIDELIKNTAFAAINSAVSPLISFGLLFLVERIFSFTSILSLEEFDNLNHELLINLNEVANGTYQHSITVSSLAEKCANAIKVDTFICKVAPYYHDIGKMLNPDYFAENIRENQQNKHDSISPYSSAKIIISHVNDGVEIAKKYKLPDKIIDIIKEHHGTTILNHFYQKAVTEEGFENVSKDKFIYPGPIPQSKESAIIMICDQIEAISRLPKDKRGNIEKAIDNVIENMSNQNQFDDSGITLKDLKIIKSTLVKQITGMSHERVEYQKEFNKK